MYNNVSVGKRENVIDCYIVKASLGMDSKINDSNIGRTNNVMRFLCLGYICSIDECHSDSANLILEMCSAHAVLLNLKIHVQHSLQNQDNVQISSLCAPVCTGTVNPVPAFQGQVAGNESH